MKKFVVDYGDRKEEVFFPSVKTLKEFLRHKLQKRRLTGIKIVAVAKNKYSSINLELKKIGSYEPGKLKCDYCLEIFDAHEITIDDELNANFICEKCLKKT